MQKFSTVDLRRDHVRGHEQSRNPVYGPNEAPQKLVDLILPELDRLVEEGREADSGRSPNGSVSRHPFLWR